MYSFAMSMTVDVLTQMDVKEEQIRAALREDYRAQFGALGEPSIEVVDSSEVRTPEAPRTAGRPRSEDLRRRWIVSIKAMSTGGVIVLSNLGPLSTGLKTY